MKKYSVKSETFNKYSGVSNGGTDCGVFNSLEEAIKTCDRFASNCLINGGETQCCSNNNDIHYVISGETSKMVGFIRKYYVTEYKH